MEEPKEEWIDSVMGSMQGSQRATPKRDLWADIEAGIDRPVPMSSSATNHWPLAAAAAVLLLVMNAWIFWQVPSPTSQAELEQTIQLSDYQIYQ